MEKFVCPQCGYVAEAPGTCPTCGVELVRQEQQPTETAPEVPADGMPESA